MIRLLEFHRSPNCAKVRVALGYKGIQYRMEEMSSADRSPMIEAAGWPLVPIIFDGDVRMRDSEAILHYLESNYRDRASLTPESGNDIQKGEAITAEVQCALRPVLRRIYGQAFRAPELRDPVAMEGIADEIGRAAAPIESELGAKDFLLGERMSLYDVLLACPLTPARPRPDYVAQSPLWAFFAEHLSLPEELRNVPGWMDRVLAHDVEPAAAR